MHKALIIILLLSFSSCAARRVAVTTGENNGVSSEEFLDSVISKNISNSAYFIEKASISIDINGSLQKMLFSCKYQKTGKFLISIKSFAGIEGARVLLTKDTLLINDRIGRRVISGEPRDIEKYTGFPYDLLGTLTGDYISTEEEQDDLIDKPEATLQTIQRLNGRLLTSDFDTRVYKLKSIMISSSISKGLAGNDSVMISFYKFTRGEICYPRQIEVKDYVRNVSAKIRLEKVQIPWEGELEFIAGKGYKNERIK